MKVFLLRHTEAAYGGPDPNRQLTSYGHKVARCLAQHIKENPYFDFSEVWVSPYLRAQQTAEPILRSRDPMPKCTEMDLLVPHGDASTLLERLNRTDKSVLLVGHNPLLGDLGKTLMGLPGHIHCPFKKGAVMVLKRDPGQETGYSLAAYLTPGSLGIRP